MTDTIEAIEGEIDKIKARIRTLNSESSSEDQDEKIKDATISLLNNVIKDLRKQQKKLRKNVDEHRTSNTERCGQEDEGPSH